MLAYATSISSVQHRCLLELEQEVCKFMPTCHGPMIRIGLLRSTPRLVHYQNLFTDFDLPDS
jgi:hypothetical protein